NPEARTDLYQSLHTHFEAMPALEPEEVQNLDQLTPAIEMYHTLIGLGKYDEAYRFYRSRLGTLLYVRLVKPDQGCDLLERLFPEGLKSPPRLSAQRARSWVLNHLARSRNLMGDCQGAVDLYQQVIAIERPDRGRSSLRTAVGAGGVSLGI